MGTLELVLFSFAFYNDYEHIGRGAGRLQLKSDIYHITG